LPTGTAVLDEAVVGGAKVLDEDVLDDDPQAVTRVPIIKRAAALATMRGGEGPTRAL